ncbi:hypothetical protein PVAND_009803 [Polypedilum vanderplanki]|uniref:N-terminal Ras-GEF domain-containing protein n=1 Tax=Polypedilum vanderplanki TaxID=319348 RepID=A0A9J6CEC6_POLVA|nr:hypothetical protein PVAND_009803 [Polypedilum vanderplanki]
MHIRKALIYRNISNYKSRFCYLTVIYTSASPTIDQSFLLHPTVNPASHPISWDCDKRADEEAGGVVTVRCDGIVLDANGAIIDGPLDAFVNLLIPVNVTEVDNNFIFTFLLSSRTFIQPHELLEKLIESVPENDESLERLVVLMKEWTRWFPYDFRGEEIMSLIKHIVASCSGNKQLSDTMSDLLSALLIKLTDLSAHEDEMKSYKRPLAEPIIVWPNSSKLAQLLCHVEKKFAKHIGPEEFMQCSPNLIKEEQQQPSISNYDVPQSLYTTFNNNNDLNTATTSLASSFIVNTTTTVQQQQQDVQSKKKTCNLENYVEWSNRLRLLVANEIMQVRIFDIKP